MSNEKGQTAATWRRVRLSPLVMPWSALPTELIVRILEDLDPYAILNCRRVMSSTIFLCWGTPRRPRSPSTVSTLLTDQKLDKSPSQIGGR